MSDESLAEDPEGFLGMAASVTDGTPVDWERVEASAPSERTRRLIRELRTVALVREVSVGSPSVAAAGMMCPSCKALNAEDADNCITCGRGLLALIRGDLLSGRYEILGGLGKGGMGVVYKAHDRDLNEVVAIKVLRAGLAVSADAAQRFRSEIKLARRVRQENVCGIHEYGQEGHLQYIVMEYVGGVDLRRVLSERGALPAEEAYDVAIQVARGLQAIHNVGIVHRDLKPSNIMRDDKGLIRLMDFGIAKQFEAEVSRGATQTGHIVGTPEYMSPEQAQGQRVDPRSDVYALAVVIFELFKGHVPFRAETPVATLLMHLQAPAPLDGLPPILVPVLRRGLAKSMEQRYASVREIEEALRAARSLRPAPAPAQAPAEEKAVSPLRVAFSILAVSGLIGAGALYLSRRPALSPGQPPARTARIEPAPTLPQPTLPVERAAEPPSSIVVAPPSEAPGKPTPLAPGDGAVLSYGEPAEATTRVAWEMVSRDSLYRFMLDTSPSFARPLIDRKAIKDNTIDLRGLEVGRYYWRVAALTKGGVAGPFSDPTSFSIARAPAVPPRPAAEPSAATTPGAESSAASVSPPTSAPKVEPAASIADLTASGLGTLRLNVKPWAEIVIDGKSVGRSSSEKILLGPGPHTVMFSHPDFEPLKRVVNVRPGASATLAVDLKDEAVPARQKRTP